MWCKIGELIIAGNSITMNSIIMFFLLQGLQEEELTGLSWNAPFIFWGGVLILVIISILYILKRRKG